MTRWGAADGTATFATVAERHVSSVRIGAWRTLFGARSGDPVISEVPGMRGYGAAGTSPHVW